MGTIDLVELWCRVEIMCQMYIAQYPSYTKHSEILAVTVTYLRPLTTHSSH